MTRKTTSPANPAVTVNAGTVAETVPVMAAEAVAVANAVPIVVSALKVHKAKLAHRARVDAVVKYVQTDAAKAATSCAKAKPELHAVSEVIAPNAAKEPNVVSAQSAQQVIVLPVKAAAKVVATTATKPKQKSAAMQHPS